MEDLVLLCPIWPRSTGPGLAMRADRIARALARRFRVHLRVVPVHELRPEAAPTHPESGAFTTAAQVWLPPGLPQRLRFRGDPERQRIAPGLDAALRASISGIDPGWVVALRHSMLPLARDLREHIAPGARLLVDLDELESAAAASVARLCDARGEGRAGRHLRRRAARYRKREAIELSIADQLWVSSTAEAERVRGATGLPARVVPNVVEEVLPANPRTGGDGTRTLLFVGILGYLPNLDAAEWTAREVLPLLRSRASGAVELRVVGPCPRRAERLLRSAPGVRVVGFAESLAGEYARADLCVVPIRAGGGTRIKLLEALAHERPVVATAFGAEGLELEPGRDLLVADDAPAFADACAKLLDDDALAGRIAGSGAARVRERYGPDRLEREVDAATAALDRGDTPP